VDRGGAQVRRQRAAGLEVAAGVHGARRLLHFDLIRTAGAKRAESAT
jgi:hypothetical protein